MKAVILVAAAVLLINSASASHSHQCKLAKDTGSSSVQLHGRIRIEEKNGKVTFRGRIKGFPGSNPRALHGFHIHENGALGNECADAGGHFNPTGATHGAPGDTVRHVGDLGNVKLNRKGTTARVRIEDSVVELSGTNSIVGKAIVVHAGEDDLGRGGDTGSLATGNAGARLACCIIEAK